MFIGQFIVQRAAKDMNLAAVQNDELAQALSTSKERIEHWCDAFHIRPCWPRLSWRTNHSKTHFDWVAAHDVSKRRILK